MALTPDDARALGEHDASTARARAEVDGTEADGMRTVFEIAEWVPEAYRQAYLDGAASVLGHVPLVES